MMKPVLSSLADGCSACFRVGTRVLAVTALTLAASAAAQQLSPADRTLGYGTSGTPTDQPPNVSSPSQVSPYPLPVERVGPTQVQDTSAPTAAAPATDGAADATSAGTTTAGGAAATRARPGTPPFTPPPPDEFERFVAQRLGRALPRFGADLVAPASRSYTAPATTVVPAAYQLGPGDEVFIGLSGSIEGSVTRRIDSNGRIFLPRVGEIKLTGVPFGALANVIERAVGTRYRGFGVSVSVSRLRGVRVYVTGFAASPGSYVVDSLSTLVNAIFAAGGPSSGGSLRSVQLIRDGRVVSDFDLYAFLRDGDRAHDEVLRDGDAVRIAPLGAQVALTGSVNQEGIYEARAGETLDDLLRFAGGTTALADPDRLILYQLAKAATVGGVEVSRRSYAAQPVTGGDIVQVLAKGTLATPLERQTVVVRVEGEVGAPGNYVVAPNTSFADVLARAGGTTPRAYVFGTNFQRISVRRQQREAYDEALRQAEVTLAGAPLTTSTFLSADQAAGQAAASRALLERLRQVQPDGRMVLPVRPDGSGLPGQLVLENNDTIVVPPQPSTVGVFGAVYRPASFLIDPTRPMRIRDYLGAAGGTLRLADTRDIFVVHANGAVQSRRTGALSAPVLPGDVVFVPTKTQNIPFLARVGAISSFLFQGAVSAAAIGYLTR